MGGKVTIDTDGNLTTVSAVTAKEFRVSTSIDPAEATIGAGAIAAGQTQVTIANVHVTPSAKIFVTATSVTGGKPLIVSQKTNGAFTVKLDGSAGGAVTFDYWIVGVVGE